MQITNKKWDEQEQKISQLVLSEIDNERALPLAVKDDILQGGKESLSNEYMDTIYLEKTNIIYPNQEIYLPRKLRR